MVSITNERITFATLGYWKALWQSPETVFSTVARKTFCLSPSRLWLKSFKIIHLSKATSVQAFLAAQAFLNENGYDLIYPDVMPLADLVIGLADHTRTENEAVTAQPEYVAEFDPRDED